VHLAKIDQVALVVRDLDKTGFRMRAAFAMTDNIQLEIIESLDGPNIYEEFLAGHGEGVHHFGVRVPDLRASVAEMESRGYVVIQAGYGTGTQGEGGFAYFETDGPLGALIELIELPRQRIAAATVYPS
jgi:hypothetical protein